VYLLALCIISYYLDYFNLDSSVVFLKNALDLNILIFAKRKLHIILKNIDMILHEYSAKIFCNRFQYFDFSQKKGNIIILKNINIILLLL